MNDPTNLPVDIEEQRAWLIDHRTATGFSWSELAKRTGIPTGTISQFGSDAGYRGNEKKLAEQVYRYRQSLIVQAEIEVAMPDRPGYFETETSRQIVQLLHYAKRGRMVAVATGAGLGKTETAKHFRACYPNVFHTTMTPSSAGVNNMQIKVLKSLGEANPRGTPQRLSERICDLLRNIHQPLLILDEMQHCSTKSIDEIRGWADEVGAGIAMFGNIRVMRQIEGQGGDDAFAQIYSRLAFRMVRPIPLQSDALALAEAWRIFDQAMIDFIVRISLVPGGLRGSTHTLELASMFAAGEGVPLSLDHLQGAWAQISGRGL